MRRKKKQKRQKLLRMQNQKSKKRILCAVSGDCSTQDFYAIVMKIQIFKKNKNKVLTI